MATISGRVLFDRDRSLTVSAGDSGLANIPVVLQNVNTTARLTVLTDATGNYSFLNVPDGSYRIVESYGAAGGVPTPGDFTAAAAGSVPQGVNPPITAATNPPPGSTNLDSLTPDTLLVTVSGVNLTNQDFYNGPVIYTPIEAILDPCSPVSNENLIQAADNGTFGSFPQGTPANTGAPTEPYPGVTPDFTYVLPNPAVYTPTGGEYTVQNIMNDALSTTIGAWWRIADHTEGNETGRMMVVNGFNPGAVFFRDVVSVQPNTYYLFTAWILNLFKVTGYPDPELGVRILDQNGGVLYSATLGTLIPPNVNAPEWKQIGSVINSQNNTSLTVEFLSEGPEVIGNDYAIDDISFNRIEIRQFIPIKTVDRENANVGETVRFTVTLTNACQSPLTNLFFRDIVPDGLSFVPESVTVNGESLAAADPNDGFPLPDVPGGETVTVSFAATITSVPSPNPTLNSAAIRYFYTPVEGGIPGEFNVESNEVPVMVSTLADVSVTKTASPSPVDAGGTLTYTITVSNSGPSPAEDVVLTDSIPAALSNVEFSTDGGSTWSPWTGSYSLGQLPNGQSRIILLRGTVNSSAEGVIENTATALSTTPDPNLCNNRDTVETPVNELADLSIVKLGSPKPAVPGEILTYSLTVSNAGPSTANNVLLTDAVPSVLTNAEFSTNNGVSWNSWTGSLPLGSVASGAIQTVLIRGVVSSSAVGIISNTAEINSTTPDPDPSNNTSTDNTEVAVSADLAVTKSGLPVPVDAGGELTYTIVVSNNGPSDAQNVVLTDNVPAELTGVEYSLNGGTTWNLWPGSINLGTLSGGESRIVLIRGQVTASASGNIVNTAVVSSPTPDPNPDNNRDTEVTPINTSADLSVTKTSSPSPAIPGQYLIYTITVRNGGPDSAVNTVLTDAVPASLDNAEFSINGGSTWEPWTGAYSLGTLANGAVQTVLIRGIVSPAVSDAIINTAVVASDTPDPDPSNNSDTNITEVSGSTSADIAVTKTVQPTPAIPGALLTYTVTVTNNGPDAAEDVILYDAVPPELSGIEFSVDGGATWRPWTNPYLLGQLAARESVTIQIRGTVSSSACGLISNTAVATSTTPDPNPDNNTATADTGIQSGADLSIQKTAYPNPACRCQYVTFTLTVSNAGPETAEQVVITDDLPAELCRPIFSTDGGRTWKPWTGTYTVGNLEADRSESILVSGFISACANHCIANTASVSSLTPDPNPSNNTDSVAVGVWENTCCQPKCSNGMKD